MTINITPVLEKLLYLVLGLGTVTLLGVLAKGAIWGLDQICKAFKIQIWFQSYIWHRKDINQYLRGEKEEKDA